MDAVAAIPVDVSPEQRSGIRLLEQLSELGWSFVIYGSDEGWLGAEARRGDLAVYARGANLAELASELWPEAERAMES